jgi:steroid delta-isomerase
MTVTQMLLAEVIQTTITDYFAATRNMDVEGYLAAFAEHALNYDPVGGTPLCGREEMRLFFQSIVGMFETVGLTEDFVHIVGKEVAVKWTGQGVGKNGRAVTFEGVDLFEMNDSGKVQTLRAYWNPSALLAKLQA